MMPYEILSAGRFWNEEFEHCSEEEADQGACNWSNLPSDSQCPKIALSTIFHQMQSDPCILDIERRCH